MGKKAKARAPKEGVCKLTGKTGRFVDSHLIPLALTRLSRTGEKYVEAGIGHGVKRRSNSWYDAQLVTREGEDILEQIDTRGIQVLRGHKLVWSGWQHGENLLSSFAFQESGPGVRVLDIPEAADLHLFFLSLLWRAAASTRPEFADVRLSPETVEDLRRRVEQKAPGALVEYPVQLSQLGDRGVEHNRTPMLERHPAGVGGRDVDSVRFYFDGLTAQIFVPGSTGIDLQFLKLCLGMLPDGKTLVFGHRWEDSRAAANIKTMAREVLRQGPGPRRRG